MTDVATCQLCNFAIADHLHIGTGGDDVCSVSAAPTHVVDCAACHQPLMTSFATVGAASFHSVDCLRAWLAANYRNDDDGPE